MFDVTYDPIPESMATFSDGLDRPVHRWFRLTPSFSPTLVDSVLDGFGATPSDVVMDPFAGASTTLVQSRLRGIPSVGVEVNPLLADVGRWSLDWSGDPDAVRGTVDALHGAWLEGLSEVEGVPLSETGLAIPTIGNVDRWWREDVLRELLVLRRCVRDVPDPTLRGYMTLALVSALVPDLTNVTLNRLQLAFRDRSDDEIDVWGTFESRASMVAEDLEVVRGNADVGASVRLGDSTRDLSALVGTGCVDLVVTSPPYPNRYSYVWNTRPQMYFLDMVSDPRESSELDLRSIGGTWGAATSSLSGSDIGPVSESVREAAWPTVDEIRKADRRMANYVARYFDDLHRHLVAIRPTLREGARLAYVVGNSELKGVYVETDRILGEMFDRSGLGFSTDSVVRFRRRHSGRDLFESIVRVAFRG